MADSLSDEMDRVRGSLPGCDLLAFADLAAGLVLCHSAARRPQQEALDAVCAEGRDLLDGPLAEAAAAALGQAPVRALALGGGGARLFLRSPEVPDEALCLTGSDRLEIGQAMRASAGLWARIGDTA